MKKSTKVFRRIAVWLCVVCLTIGAISLLAIKLDLFNLSRINYEYNSYDDMDIVGEFDRIVIETKTADISIGNGSPDICKVDCNEEKRLKHTVTVQDGTLLIKVEDTRKWYDNLVEPREDTRVWVRVPVGKYKSLEIKSDTGDVVVGVGFAYQFDKVTVETGTGNVIASAKVLEELKVKTTTGAINISNRWLDLWYPEETESKDTLLISAETDAGGVYLEEITCRDLAVKSQTGNVTFQKFDAQESISVETDAGDVSGTLLSEKTFYPKTDTGRISVPETTGEVQCWITTNTGDINIEIVGE